MDQAIRDLFFDACNNALRWGPGLLIALVILYGLYKLFLRLGKDVGLKILGALEKPSDALNHQADALTRQADALTRQVESVDRLSGSIREFVQSDRTEHREIIMLQKVILDRIEGLRNGQV